MGKMFVTIRMDDDGTNHVFVNVDGQRITDEEEQWIAFMAIPKLERFVWNSEEARQRYHERLAGAKAV